MRAASMAGVDGVEQRKGRNGSDCDCSSHECDNRDRVTRGIRVAKYYNY